MRKIQNLLAGMLVVAMGLFAQAAYADDRNDAAEKVYTVAEQMPMFPGGDAELFKWIAANIQYPPELADVDVQGRVMVRFVVLKDGSIGEVKLLRSLDPYLDREAIRVIKSLPKMVPGKMNGRAVNVWMTIPVTFRLMY